MPLDIERQDWRAEESNEKWRRAVAARYGEDKLAAMLRTPALNQRCPRCLKHFGLECLCTRAELRAFARGQAMVELGPVDKAVVGDICPQCLERSVASGRAKCWGCIKAGQRSK